MKPPKSFKDLGVKARTLSGDKITIHEIIDKEIIVVDYRIKDSNYGKKNDDAKCLHLQINYEEQNRVVFCGSTVLMDMIDKVPPDGFPFTTTIIKERDWYKFT